MITLWGRNNSSNVKKVRWILEELELPYEHILAGGAFGLNREAEFLAMNPNGLVPLLRDDETDVVLWESNTIVRYLAAQYGQRRLWNDEPAVRAGGKVDGLGAVHAGAETRYFAGGAGAHPVEKRDNAAIEAGINACEALFALLDDALAQQPWLSGAEFGPGDIAVAPFIYNLYNIGLSWTPRPHLERWYQTLTQRPAFRDVVMIPVT
jgi:glutathione S-transferase